MTRLSYVFLSVAAFLASTTAFSKDIIKIDTDHTQMIICAEKGAPANFLYWGETIQDEDFAGRFYGKRPDSSEPRVYQAYPAYGGTSYLSPALRVVHPDGSLTTELVYDSCRRENIGDGIEQTVIVLKEPAKDITVEVYYKAYKKEDVICQSAVLRNTGRKSIEVKEFASSYIPFHSRSYYLSHFGGTWAHEMQMTEEKLSKGTKSIESRKGVRTTQSDSPSFVLSLNSPVQEYSGDVYAGTLAWSGNFRLNFELDEYGILGITSGMNPFAADFTIGGGKSASTPEMVLTYSPAGLSEVTHHFHDWGRKYGLAHGNELRPVLLNSWEGAYFTFDEDLLTGMMDHAAEFGLEMFVLDDGWFGNEYPRNKDNAGLGDWQVNVSKLPRGISYLADYAVSKGLQFGIWIEPEMVNPDSNLAHAHPDWIVGDPSHPNPTMRNQWLLDLTNPMVQDFVEKTFNDVLALSPNITYIKWDANRHVENVWSNYLGEKNQSRFWQDYVEGLYSVYEKIRKAHPDVQIQLCSSGGGRMEYGALKYHDEFWASDNTNALDRIFIQYGAGIFFPVKAAASHVSTSPNHQTGQMTPLKFRFDVAMTGRLGMELQPSSLTGNDADFVRKAIRTYKEIRPVIQLGDLYRLISPYEDSGYASEMFVSKDKSEAVFFNFCLEYHGRSEFLTAKMKGLDPNRKYLVEEINCTGKPTSREHGKVLSGDYLMKAGVELFMIRPFDSIVFRLTAQN